MKNFVFKGLMVPVFTPFNEDKKRSIDWDAIDKYGAFLRQKGVQGVMVNGLTGEGMTLRIDERKRLAEEWFRVAKKYQLKFLLNIGGTDVADVYEMAEHAEKLGVDGILVLPDLFYRPVVEEDLLYYIRDVAKYAPNTPILYYHIPVITNVYLRMWRFYDLAEKEINNFGGIYYADYNLDQAVDTYKTDRTVIMGVSKSFLGALALGFESISVSVMNLYPEWFVEMYEYVNNYQLKEAQAVQEKIFKQLNNVWVRDEDWIVKVKAEFNKLDFGFRVGATRKPVWTGSWIQRPYHY